ALLNGNPPTRSQAARWLGSLGADAAKGPILNALAQVLEATRGDLAREAAESLGLMGAAAATKQVVAALLDVVSGTDAESDLRSQVNALAEMDNLVDRETDEESDLRLRAIRALGRM